MAYDKVTKIDSIAKRAAWSKVHQGKLVEYVGAYHKATVDAPRLPDTNAQATITVSKRGKMFRRQATVADGISTSWPVNHGLRKARKR